MRTDIIILATAVGLGTYLFRFLPTRMNLTSGSGTGRLARGLAAVGTAAITTLVVAGIMPDLTGGSASLISALAGLAGVTLAHILTRNVAFATLCGALAYRLAYAATH